MDRRISTLLTFLLCAVLTVSAQIVDVTGTVTSTDDGLPVVGATVTVKGTNVRTVTDSNGKFHFKQTPAGSNTVVVSYVGMETAEAGLKKNMRVQLTPVTTHMDELIVVAFGKQKRESFTGSAATLNAGDISERQVSNPLAALSGKVAGVQIVEGNGPGSEPEILVRGISSVNAGIDPLIVLDGMPYNGYYRDINPADVESISVLKDAASTALYGARGANGVVLITTKQAKRGEAVITLDAKWGANTNARVNYETIDNTGQYYEMHYKALYNYYRNALGYDALTAHRTANSNMGATATAGGLGFLTYSVPAGQFLIGENGRMNPKATPGNIVTNNGQQYMLLADDWEDEAMRTGLRQEYNLNVNGGSDRFQAYASVGYMKNEGVVEAAEFERYSGRFKADWQAKSWLKIGANMSYTHSETDGRNTAFYTAITMPPIYPVYIRDGNGNIMYDAHGKMYDYGEGKVTGQTRLQENNDNTLQTSMLDVYTNNTNAFGVQGYAEITFLRDFKLTTNASVYDTELRIKDGLNPYYGYYATSDGEMTVTQGRYYGLNTQQLLNWTREFGRHTVSALLGHEYNRSKNTETWARKTNFVSYDKNQELDGLISTADAGGGEVPYNVEGYFFRGQYDYDDKYFGSFSFRRDGSSRFHPAHRWGNFWSVGGAWIVSKEKWQLPKWVNMLKLKASFGQQGNDAIYDFGYTDLYTITTAGGRPSLLFYTKGNSDITWETNTNFNAGIEFELLGGRLSGSVEYYHRKTTDMLMWFNTPANIGYSGYYDNVGDMVNKGVEIGLEGVPVRTKDITWSLSLNLTHNRNRVTYLPDENKLTKVSGKAGYISSYHYVGEDCPINTWYLPKYAGVSEEGLAQFYVGDSETGEITGVTTDPTYATWFLCDDPNPDFYGGFGTQLKAFGFDLSANFQYSVGGKALDYDYRTLMEVPYPGSTGQAIHKDQLNAWSADNASSDIPRWQYGDEWSNYICDRFLTDASYLVFKNVSLGYTLPKSITEKLKLSSVRIYASCDNVAYWTKRKGFDPRSALDGETASGGYAPMRTISGGISVKF